MTDAPRYFFGIGAQKAGTTWLHDVLDSYPDCAVPELKELHFFDTRHLEGDLKPIWIYKERLKLMAQLAAGFERDIGEYYALVEAADEKARQVPPAQRADPSRRGGPPRTFQDGYLRKVNVELRLANIERLARYLRIREPADYVRYIEDMRRHKGAHVAGEFSPSYALLPADAYREMTQLLPDCRFIFIMRDPVDRFFSQLRFRKKVQALRGLKDFEPVPYFDEAISDPNFLHRSDYRHTVETLESVIPRDRILYLFFEEMVAPESVVDNMRRVEAFLGLAPKPDADLVARCEQRSNASEGASFSENQVKRARDALAPVYAFVAERFGRLPAAWAPVTAP